MKFLWNLWMVHFSWKIYIVSEIIQAKMLMSRFKLSFIFHINQNNLASPLLLYPQNLKSLKTPSCNTALPHFKIFECLKNVEIQKLDEIKLQFFLNIYFLMINVQLVKNAHHSRFKTDIFSVHNFHWSHVEFSSKSIHINYSNYNQFISMVPSILNPKFHINSIFNCWKFEIIQCI